MKKFFRYLCALLFSYLDVPVACSRRWRKTQPQSRLNPRCRRAASFLLPNPEEPQEESSSITLVPDFRASATTNTERICDTIDDTVLFTKQIQETSFLLPAVTETGCRSTLCCKSVGRESDAEAAKLSSLASDTYHTLLADDEMLNFYGYSYYTLDAITPTGRHRVFHDNIFQQLYRRSPSKQCPGSLQLQPGRRRPAVPGRGFAAQRDSCPGIHDSGKTSGKKQMGLACFQSMRVWWQRDFNRMHCVPRPISGIFPILALWFFSIHMTYLLCRRRGENRIPPTRIWREF